MFFVSFTLIVFLLQFFHDLIMHPILNPRLSVSVFRFAQCVSTVEVSFVHVVFDSGYTMLDPYYFRIVMFTHVKSIFYVSFLKHIEYFLIVIFKFVTYHFFKFVKRFIIIEYPFIILQHIITNPWSYFKAFDFKLKDTNFVYIWSVNKPILFAPFFDGFFYTFFLCFTSLEIYFTQISKCLISFFIWNNFDMNSMTRINFYQIFTPNLRLCLNKFPNYFTYFKQNNSFLKSVL